MKNNEKNIIYMPERVFVHNLYKYCNTGICTLYKKINTFINDDITIKTNEIETQIANWGDKGGQFFTSSFKKFVKEREFITKEKAPNYCLLQCYNILTHSVCDSMSSGRGASTLEENSNLLKEYTKYISDLKEKDFSIISTRELQRLLDPSGRPYKYTQLSFLSYLVKRVLPTLIEIDRFKNDCNDWEHLVFYSGTPFVQRIFIQADKAKIEQKLNQTFKKISNIHRDNYVGLGKLLYEIFCYIKEQYDKGNLGFNHNVNSLSTGNQQDNINVDNSYYYDSKLSSHIIWFMRWLPLISDDCDNENLLLIISNVIESIRASLYNSCNKEVIMESLNRNPSENLFIYEDLALKTKYAANSISVKEFRMLLFKALQNESSFKNMVDDMYKTNSGGTIL